MRKRINPHDPQFVVRAIVGILLAANVAAAVLVLFPPGGSAEDLEQQASTLQSQLTARKAALDLTRAHAAAVEKGRTEGDEFLNEYFIGSRTAFSTLLTQLEE